MHSLRPGYRLLLLVALILLVTSGLAWRRNGKATAQWTIQGVAPWDPTPSYVEVQKLNETSFTYLVNGSPQVFIGMGYNPIYRDLPAEQRDANYRRDFRILCEAGVNHITGWDADKGYEQDKFDELTLDIADEYGIGVIMPFYLAPEANYRDPEVLEDPGNL